MAFLFGCEGIPPAKTVLDNVTLGVHEGDRIGIVGQNGDGKSTLLGVLAGSVEPDEGLVRHTRGLRIGMLGQRDSLEDEASVEYAVVGDTPEYVWAGDPRVREVISALIADIAWDAKVKTLSGGQRRRVDLARLLVGDWDVLMLDEPTNHLDMHAIAWLARLRGLRPPLKEVPAYDERKLRARALTREGIELALARQAQREAMDRA